MARNRHPFGVFPSRAVPVGFAVLGILLMAAPGASAADESKVISGDSQLTFIGSNTRHELHVRMSEVDVQRKELPARQASAEFDALAAQAASGWAGFAASTDEIQGDPAATVEEQLDSLTAMTAPILAAASTPSEFKQFIRSFLTRSKEMLDAFKDLLTKIDLRKAAHTEFGKAVDGGVGTKILAARDAVVEAEKAYNVAAATLRQTEAALRPYEQGLVEMLESPPQGISKDTFYALRAAASRMLEKVRLARLSSLIPVAIAVVLASSAYSWAFPADAESEQTIVIEDFTGNPIKEQDDGCHHLVRRPGGGDALSAVSCVIPERPSVWSVLDALFNGEPVQLWPGIRIVTGDSNDEIVVELPPTADVALLSVAAGAGDDRITVNGDAAGTAEYKWESWIAAGPGSDLVKGGPQRDQVWGDVIVAGTEPAGANNDRISLQGGDDRGEGGWGHDLLLGGSGDDALSDIAGSNVMVGGPGRDSLENGSGDVLIVARELYGEQAADNAIDCGSGARRYVLLGESPDASGLTDYAYNCQGSPPVSPTIASLSDAWKQIPPAQGEWSWFG